MSLSSRYIQDRFLPDKAVDLMDEAASRIKTRGLTTPPHLMELEQEIRRISRQKKQAADVQEYERAAVLRDTQNALVQELTKKQTEWQKADRMAEETVQMCGCRGYRGSSSRVDKDTGDDAD